LGHRTIAFLTSLPDAAWSRERFEGISECFSKAGCSSGVRLASYLSEVSLPLVLTTAGLNDNEVKRMIAAGRTPSQAKDLELQWKEALKKGHPTQHKQYRASGLYRSLNGLKSILHQRIDSDFIDAISIAAIKRTGERFFGLSMEPLFSQALDIREATAWVCVNDGIAFEALSFLQSKGKKVPADISVVGFDNFPVTSIERRLTSLDFNAAGFVSRMLGFILRPPRPRGHYRHSTIQVEGIIMERDTAGKAK
jgi:DNA-binding LacI/PurR family transcriptional regulator